MGPNLVLVFIFISSVFISCKKEVNIAAIGFFSPDGKTIYGQSLNFPYKENWLRKFNGACGKQ